MRILVVGAGIAGSCAANVLREAGHDVVVTDPAPHMAASRCAFAVTRLAWWGADDRATVRRSLDWYNRRGHIITKTAVVHDARRGRTTIQGDHYLINPTITLVKPDLSLSVKGWKDEPGAVIVHFQELDSVRYGAVVLAAGVGMRHLTRTPGQEPGISYGGMFTAPGNRLTDGGQLAMLRRTDRLSYTAAWLIGETRIGASRCSSPGQAHRVADGIRDRMLSEGVVTGSADDWEYRAGVRYATGSPGVSRLGERVWSLTGLARSGYAIAPAAALDIAAEIGEL